MTPDSCSRELSDGLRVIDAGYRSRSDLSRLTSLSSLPILTCCIPTASPIMYFSTMYECQTSSSSSSSSLSGVTTPLDGVPPKLVPFPKSLSSKAGLTSSDSSLSSLDRHRICSLSFSQSPLSPTHRPIKLSLGSAKATPIPAIPSAPEEHSPLGAFSLTSSAEGHLRSLVTRIASPRTPSKFTDTTPQKERPQKRERASSLRSFSVPWASISDIEEEEETFWPRQRPVARQDDVPSISRSPSPPKPSDTETRGYSDPRTRYASIRSVTVPKVETHSKLRKPGHGRANSYAGPSAPQPRAVSNLRLAEAGQSSASSGSSVPRAFLRSPMKNKGKAAARSPPPRGHSSIRSKERALTLDPALAAAESASRLRAKCVCVVCGRLGVDYPRCPRCCATWCSRECRVSDAPAGSARHLCNGKSNGKIPVGASPLRVAA
ncbi:hypothetical protein ACEPAH_8768 [Sanghuangporus vaninii]